MTFGEEGKEGTRVHTLKGVEDILDVFQKHGHSEVSIHSWNCDLRARGWYMRRWTRLDTTGEVLLRSI